MADDSDADDDSFTVTQIADYTDDDAQIVLQ